MTKSCRNHSKRFTHVVLQLCVSVMQSRDCQKHIGMLLERPHTSGRCVIVHFPFTAPAFIKAAMSACDCEQPLGSADMMTSSLLLVCVSDPGSGSRDVESEIQGWSCMSLL